MMVLLLVLLISISNCFDITNASVTVCKYLNDNSSEKEINHDKNIFFYEDDEEKDKQLIFASNKSEDQLFAVEIKLTRQFTSLEKDLEQLNSTSEDLSSLLINQSNEMQSLQQSFEQIKNFIRVHIERFSDCSDVSRAGYTSSGVYNITVPGRANPLQVYCDLDTDGGGWLVFQRRMNGSVDFYRNWTDYQDGFGNLNGEFWLASRPYQLRIDFEDWDGNTVYAIYRNFSVGSSQSNYSLGVSDYNGTAGDSLHNHNNKQFSTKDRDNDESTTYHCAYYRHGAWWYNACHQSNLNGKYLRNGEINHKGVTWYHWKTNWYSMKRVEMKIKPN